jgi:hypothetical protein
VLCLFDCGSNFFKASGLTPTGLVLFVTDVVLMCDRSVYSYTDAGDIAAL